MFAVKCVMFYLSLAVLKTNAGVVSFVEPCHYNNTLCVLKSSNKALPYIIAGIPEMGIPSSDPLVLEDVNGDNRDLKLQFKDIVVKNLTKCEFTYTNRPEKSIFEIELVCPIMSNGKYTLAGKLLNLDVEGNGDFEIKTDKYNFFVYIHVEVIERDGQEYYKFSSFDYKHEALDKVFFKFDNLFNGDKAKAAPVISFLDRSWKETTNEIAKPVLKEIITRIISGIGQMFLQVPRKEIELDYSDIQ